MKLSVKDLATLLLAIGTLLGAIREFRGVERDQKQSWENHGWAAEEITRLQQRVGALEGKCRGDR